MARGATYYRRLYGVKQSISEHFACYKFFYILLGVCALIGIVVGLITGFRYSADMKLEHLSDALLLKFIERDISIVSLFFTRFFIALGLFVLIWLSNLKPWLCFITPIIIIYRAFLIGLNCAVLIVLFKLGGIINVLVVYIPTQIIMLGCLIIWGSVCMRQNIYSKHTNCPCVSMRFLANTLTVLIFCLSGLLIACLLEAILLPVLTASFFLGIS